MILRAFILALVVALGSAVEEVVVRTGKGDVRGIRVDSDKGFYYYSFRGVRYAQPPTGKLRFQVILGTTSSSFLLILFQYFLKHLCNLTKY